MEQQALAHDHFKQALSKFHQGAVRAGLDDLEEAIRLNPERWEYFWTRGAFNYRRRAYPAALSDLTEAIRLCPEAELAAKIYQRRMFCYGRLEDYERLVEDATWLIDHGFAEPTIYEWRGWAKYIMGDLDGAIDNYSRALDLSPDSFHYRLYRAVLYCKSDRYDAALDDIDYALVMTQREADMGQVFAFTARQYRALVFYRLGDNEKSFTEYNAAQEIGGYKPFANVESYVASIQGSLEHLFSGMPPRPSDQIFLKRRGAQQPQNAL